jgi:D-tyrosyl-tRNA(Tyr) deacylase
VDAVSPETVVVVVASVVEVVATVVVVVTGAVLVVVGGTCRAEAPDELAIASTSRTAAIIPAAALVTVPRHVLSMSITPPCGASIPTRGHPGIIPIG